MDIGVGLPVSIPGVDGRAIVEWARQGEDRGFASLGTIDRLVYGNHEPLTALAAAAAVTARARLMTAILIAPLRSNAALLAKQAATVDSLSGGRLVLGMAVGGREDDYAASGVDFHRRGRLLDTQLEEMHHIWAGEPRGVAGAVGPATRQRGGPPVVLGGQNPAAMARVARWGDGWISGGGGPQFFAAGAKAAQAAWDEAGREGRPRLLALAYFALGPDATERANGYLRDYYAFAPGVVDLIAGGALTSPGAVRAAMDAFAAAGCDELILVPCSPDIAQVDLLAQAVGG
jgi:alkanesulfonate monooxygenase SsuD/methylene tetrahydromethanopterin reductase-like flavin-dependent oxidoreductase (luciferase family)